MRKKKTGMKTRKKFTWRNKHIFRHHGQTCFSSRDHQSIRVVWMIYNKSPDNVFFFRFARIFNIIILKCFYFWTLNFLRSESAVNRSAWILANDSSTKSKYTCRYEQYGMGRNSQLDE